MGATENRCGGISAEMCIRSCARNRNPRQDYSTIQTSWGPETLDNKTPSSDGAGNAAGDQTAIVQHLAMPGVLGVSAPKRMMTHGAYVFLVGDRAYKLKRDVKYSYMDFSTQAQRDAAALAEIRINRRTAPDLYLGVAPVFNNGGDIRIGDVSDKLMASAQEHLVVMRRFDETQTLDVLADAGAVDGALAERLAVQIAQFHSAAPGMVVDGAATKLASISGRTMRDLVAGLDALGEQIIAKLHEAMQATLIQALSEVDERGQAGLVRRLHGDLHLGNVALIEGAPVIFDALEFDDAMATVDVLHDAAFLGMDLWTRGLQDAAARMWSRYLAERRDYSGLALAPVFFSMRAAVRAKTALHRAGLTEGEEAAASLTEAQRYAEAALALLERPSARLVAIGGLSGSGKTTIARTLAPSLAVAGGAVHIRSDVIRKLQQGVPAEEKLPPGAYTKDASAAVYKGMFEAAADCLKQSAPVILDAVFADEAERAQAEAVANRINVPFDSIWLDCEAGARQDRVADRTGDASDATPEVAARQAEYDLGTMHWRRILGDDDAPAAAKRVLKLPR